MKRKIDGGKLVFTFDNGLESITFDSSKASTTCKEHAHMHGWSARIGDGAALSRKQKDGTVIDITEQMRRDEIQRLVSHYESGTEAWDLKAQQSQNPLILALAAQMGVDYAEAARRLGSTEIDKLAAFLSAE